MQVYRDLRILTARPSPEEEIALPHALYGHVDAAAPYSVARWLEDARAAIDAAHADGRLPIFVGGTGLYLSALKDGLSAVPPIPADIREKWRERQRVEPADALHAELRRTDPQMAERLAPSDRQRIVRALEVAEGTGRSLAEWHHEREPGPMADAKAVRVVLAPPRMLLRDKIAERFEGMFEAGAVDEARALVDRGLAPSTPALKAIGVEALSAFSAGRLSRSDAITQAVTETRQYAKRQETWFRHRFKAWPRAETVSDASELVLSEMS